MRVSSIFAIVPFLLFTVNSFSFILSFVIKTCLQAMEILLKCISITIAMLLLFKTPPSISLSSTFVITIERLPTTFLFYIYRLLHVLDTFLFYYLLPVIYALSFTESSFSSLIILFACFLLYFLICLQFRLTAFLAHFRFRADLSSV